jgi:hypothetical protein
MRTEQKWSLWCAIAVLVQVCAMRSLPYDLTGAASNLWHFLALATIGLLLWVAFDANRVVRFFTRRAKPCAASSPR